MRTAVILATYFAVLAFGSYQAFAPGFDSHFARMQTERGDGMLNHYILEHSWQYVSNPDYCGSLFSPPCFYPERFTIWYSEHLLGVAPVYWALRLVLPYDLAYHWWQILVSALNFVTFAVVVRWLGGPHSLAILGGYLWAFALVHLDQIKHQQMIPRFWMPFVVYYAGAFVLTPTTRALNRLLAAVFFQCVICMNTGWFLVAGLGLYLPLAIGLQPGAGAAIWRFIRANAIRVTALVGGWGTALVVAFLPYIIINWGMSRAYTDSFGLMPTPSAWLTGPPGSRWEQTLGPYLDPTMGECYLFFGFGVYFLLLAAAVDLLIVRRVSRSAELSLAAAALLTAAFFALASTTTFHGGPSLWQWIREIPGGSAIRCVSRVYVIVQLFGLVGGLVWLNSVTRSLSPRVRALVLAGIAALLIVEQTGCERSSFEKGDFYPIAERLTVQIRGADAAYIVPVYTDTNGYVLGGVYGEVLGMWAGMRANVPVVNGYSGRWPPGNHPHDLIATDAMLREWLSGRFHGKLAIVHPDQPENCRVIWIE